MQCTMTIAAQRRQAEGRASAAPLLAQTTSASVALFGVWPSGPRQSFVCSVPVRLLAYFPLASIVNEAWSRPSSSFLSFLCPMIRRRTSLSCRYLRRCLSFVTLICLVAALGGRSRRRRSHRGDASRRRCQNQFPRDPFRGNRAVACRGNAWVEVRFAHSSRRDTISHLPLPRALSSASSLFPRLLLCSPPGHTRPHGRWARVRQGRGGRTGRCSVALWTRRRRSQCIFPCRTVSLESLVRSLSLPLALSFFPSVCLPLSHCRSVCLLAAFSPHRRYAVFAILKVASYSVSLSVPCC